MIARVLPCAAVLLALIGCQSLSSDLQEAPMTASAPKAVDTGAPGGGGGAVDAKPRRQAEAPPAGVVQQSKLLSKLIGTTGDGGDAVAAQWEDKERGALDGDLSGRPEPEPADDARVRTWFPEAFVWRPLVETDADGVAEVELRVPDQLTTWRLLALAHDRAGHQSGAVHTFDSALPVAVDPVVPGWLFVGDRVVLPVQAQALGSAFAGSVTVRADGALSGSGGGPVAMGPGGTRTTDVLISADRSGNGTVSAELSRSPGGAGESAGTRVDGAVREVVVRPAGRPIPSTRGGVLAGPRTFTLDSPEATEQQVVVRVFPGPLAVLHAELDRIGASPPGAYAYALIDGVQDLSAVAGVEVDQAALRTLRIRAWQRLVRQARSPGWRDAASLLHGLGEPDEDLARTTRDRLARVVETGQRGDGTWSYVERSTLQEVLVQTAMAARSLPATATGARLRAGGALERNRPSVDDPYTAAWLLASGVIDPSLRPELQTLVIDALKVSEDGRRTLVLPEGVRDPFGRVPSRAEALAVTSLALSDRADLDWRGDLVSELLQGWSAERGFGAGWADAVALAAVREGLASLDKPVQVFLERDGQVVATGQVDPAQPKLPAVLLASDGGAFTVRSEPAVPGLAFVATHTAWVPYTGTERLPGVDVQVRTSALSVGRPGSLTVELSAPSGAEVRVVQGLPSGASVEVPEATAMMLGEPAEITQDQVAFVTRPFGAGEVMTLSFEVTPGYAGRMATGPLELEVAGRAVQLAPLVWDVARGEGT